MAIELTPAGAAERPLLSGLLQQYLAGFAAFRAQRPEADGTYAYPYLDAYFTEAAREACLLLRDGSPAGFTMTRRLGSGAREVSEFFVLPRYRRLGLGRAAALRLLHRHPGDWALSYDDANLPAARFWPAVARSAAFPAPVRTTRLLPPAAPYPGTRLEFRVGPG